MDHTGNVQHMKMAMCLCYSQLPNCVYFQNGQVGLHFLPHALFSITMSVMTLGAIEFPLHSTVKSFIFSVLFTFTYSINH